MNLRICVAWLVGVTLLALSAVSAEKGKQVERSDIADAVPNAFFDAATTAPDPLNPNTETVIFSDIVDAVPNAFFDAATTAPDSLNPNKLIIGLHTGFDMETWTKNTFAASTTAFHRPSAMDTISFLIEAPVGFYISKISYRQSGEGFISRTGKASGGVNWVVDGAPDHLGLFGADPTLSHAVDLTGQNKGLVQVSITNSMFVFATPDLGTATITVTSAEVLVELLPLLP